MTFRDDDAVIVSAVRTAITKFGGSFKTMKAGDLSAAVMMEAIARAKIEASEIDDVVWGRCIQDFDEPNVARCGALKAGIPKEVPAYTVQRQCSSAMQAVQNARLAVVGGDAEVVLCGGVESYSTAPYVIRSARWGARLQHKPMEDSIWDLLHSGGKLIMGQTAELIAKKWNISREESDAIAVRSHNNAENAIKAGKFAKEIVPVEVSVGRGKKITVDTDEHVRYGLTLEEASGLAPAFEKDGVVTVASASGINDGAAGMVVTSGRYAKEHGLQVIARIGDFGVAGVDPDYMGEGPIPAAKKMFSRSKYQLDDVELIELNEAFAPQYLACEKGIGLKREITNVNGSGCGLGHPVGCTGARIIVSLIYEMQRRDLGIGMAGLCAGGGMGTSILIHRD